MDAGHYRMCRIQQRAVDQIWKISVADNNKTLSCPRLFNWFETTADTKRRGNVFLAARSGWTGTSAIRRDCASAVTLPEPANFTLPWLEDTMSNPSQQQARLKP